MGYPDNVAAPPDPHPLDDLAVDAAGCLEKAVRKAALTAKASSGISIGYGQFECQAMVVDDERFELYAPLMTRLLVPADGDPKRAAEEWCDALELFIADVRAKLGGAASPNSGVRNS